MLEETHYYFAHIIILQRVSSFVNFITKKNISEKSMPEMGIKPTKIPIWCRIRQKWYNFTEILRMICSILFSIFISKFDFLVEKLGYSDNFHKSITVWILKFFLPEKNRPTKNTLHHPGFEPWQASILPPM